MDEKLKQILKQPSKQFYEADLQSNTASPFENRQFNEGHTPPKTTINPIVNHPMFQGINDDQRRKLSALPSENLNEILFKWDEQRRLALGKKRDDQKGPVQQISGRQSNRPIWMD